MAEFKLQTPILLLIFNRPETTKRVIAQMRNAKPRELFISADGPRDDAPEDHDNCEAARLATETIDWDCEVHRNYFDFNLGVDRHVPEALNLVFSHVDKAIILEDDCLPHPTFFRFCEELLDFYKYDERVMHISGVNFQFGRRITEYSYYFSRFTHCWGWASWSRAWKHFRSDFSMWPEYRRSGGLEHLFPGKCERKFWDKRFQKTYEKKIPATWDRLWFLGCLMQGGLSIIPSVNLVSNIGFGPESTHTKDPESRSANVPAEEMPFPLQHPPHMTRNVRADTFTQKVFFSPERLKYIKWRIKNAFKLPSLRCR